MCATVTPPAPRSRATSVNAAIIRARWISATPARPPPRSTSGPAATPLPAPGSTPPRDPPPTGAARRRPPPRDAAEPPARSVTAITPLPLLPPLRPGSLALASLPLLVRSGLLRLRAAGDRDLRTRVDFRAVLPDEFGRHRETRLAEVAVRRERRELALRQRQFKRPHRHIRD